MIPGQYLLKDKDVEREFGIARSTLCKKRVTGGGPTFVRIGRGVYYERTEVIRWLEAHRVKSTSEVLKPCRS
jgi:predicted DNA-binding transcriptional regulator AlpA